MINEKCINCSYSCQTGSVYECRFNPPVVTSLGTKVVRYFKGFFDVSVDSYDHSAFPEVDPDWWCSKFVNDVSLNRGE